MSLNSKSEVIFKNDMGFRIHGCNIMIIEVKQTQKTNEYLSVFENLIACHKNKII